MSVPLAWEPDDGGRAAAGFRGVTGDCVVRAVAIATGRPYREVYDEVNEVCGTERRTRRRKSPSSSRTGVHKATTRRYLERVLGWTWHPTMGIGTGCQVHLAEGELPGGILIASVSRHVVAVLDGVVHDNHDSIRGGTRCVYGYWIPPANEPKENS